MKRLLDSIRKLRDGKVGETVDARIRQFEACGRRRSCFLFNELCFCILTANYNARGGIRIQEEIGGGFSTLSKKKLAGRLRKLGHRFPNTRAQYIVEARAHGKTLKEKLRSFKDERELRNWLAENVKGLGMKEASHFLRNIGCKNVAIIDFHIIDVLARHRLIRRPKTLTRKRYLEVEVVLDRLAKRLGMTLAELDLYLWYLETGKILK